MKKTHNTRKGGLTVRGQESAKPEDLSRLPWQEIKRRVEAGGGAYKTKPEGIEFLMRGQNDAG